MQGNVHVFLGTVGTSHNPKKALLDMADRMQYFHADACGLSVFMSIPEVLEMGNHFSCSIHIFSVN